MRGDQLGREWRIIGATEAYLNRLTLINVAKPEENFKRAINRHPDPLSAAGSPHYAETVGRAKTRPW
jgi:hypothetical protein